MILLLSFDAFVIGLRHIPWLALQIGYDTIELWTIRRPGIVVASLILVHAIVLLLFVVQVFMARDRRDRALWIALLALLVLSTFVAGVAYMEFLKDLGWRESDGFSLRWN